MKETILNVLKKMRTDYGNNENIIFAQDSDLDVVADELLVAINYTRCSTQLKDKEKMTFSNWLRSKGFKFAFGDNYENMHGTLVKADELGIMYVEYLNL